MLQHLLTTKSVLTLTPAQRQEMQRCKADVAYFINTYVMILNATDETWEPFTLWPAQREVLGELHTHRQLVILKARQLGLTWLCLGYILWRMVFYPIATVGIFSRTEPDAQELLDKRLKGMYARLPAWMQGGRVVENNKTSWQLSNGSTAMAFATTGGRQYTFSLAMVDEADFQPDLPSLLSAVKPAIDAGGRMWQISSANKDQPESRFKRVYRSAKVGSEWHPVFLPWSARPERTAVWHKQQQTQCLAETGALDDVYGEYPATDAEAMAPRELDKRIPARWLTAIYTELRPVPLEDFAYWGLPSLPNLEVYRIADEGHRYVVGGDPSEGNPNSDPSALTILDVDTGEEVAALSGRIEPTVFASYADLLACYYNNAAIMFERNNHGHACIAWLREHSQCRILKGFDDKRGWLNNSLGKVLMYTAMSDCARDELVALHSFETYSQLASIEASSLSAPEGLHDDRADSCALANVGRTAILGQKEEEPRQPSLSVVG